MWGNYIFGDVSPPATDPVMITEDAMRQSKQTKENLKKIEKSKKHKGKVDYY